MLKFFFLRKRRSQPFNCGLPLSPPPPPKPDRMECCHGRSKYHVSVTCFLFPQLPLDGSNMNHQTPQLCGVAMQGEEALNPITCYHPKLGPAIPKRDVIMGICTTSNAQEVPPSQLMPIRRGQWFRNDCERRRAATTPSTSWSCQGSFHSLCFKKRTLDPILDFRQPLDVTFPYSLKKLSS